MQVFVVQGVPGLGINLDPGIGLSWQAKDARWCSVG
jgi:hypothetical protein